MNMTPNTKSRLLAASALILGLSACADGSIVPSWSREAGAFLGAESSFGDSTRLNTGVMSGEIEVAHNMNARFTNEVNTTVNFAFNSAVIDAAAAEILTVQANFIRQFPEVTFRVYGHTDLVGSDSYNKSLGLRRARAVVAFFASRGISTSRLEAVVSYGETQPVIVTEQRELQNRRTVTEVSGFVKNHPMVLNGKYAQVIYREYVASAVPSTEIQVTATASGETEGQ